MAAAVDDAQLVSRMDWQSVLRGQFQGEKFKEEAKRLVSEANALESTIHDRRQEIEHDSNLSPQGRNNALVRMREQLRPRVQQFGKKAEEFRGIRQREKAKRTEPEPEGEAVTIAARAREIRDSLKGSSEAEILQTLQRAGEDGNLEVVKAIEDAPMPLADADAIARVSEQRLARKFPEATQRLSDQEAMIELLDSMAIHLDRRLEA